MVVVVLVMVAAAAAAAAAVVVVIVVEVVVVVLVVVVVVVVVVGGGAGLVLDKGEELFVKGKTRHGSKSCGNNTCSCLDKDIVCAGGGGGGLGSWQKNRLQCEGIRVGWQGLCGEVSRHDS